MQWHMPTDKGGRQRPSTVPAKRSPSFLQGTEPQGVNRSSEGVLGFGVGCITESRHAARAADSKARSLGVRDWDKGRAGNASKVCRSPLCCFTSPSQVGRRQPSSGNPVSDQTRVRRLTLPSLRLAGVQDRVPCQPNNCFYTAVEESMAALELIQMRDHATEAQARAAAGMSAVPRWRSRPGSSGGGRGPPGTGGTSAVLAPHCSDGWVRGGEGREGGRGRKTRDASRARGLGTSEGRRERRGRFPTSQRRCLDSHCCPLLLLLLLPWTSPFWTTCWFSVSPGGFDCEQEA